MNFKEKIKKIIEYYEGNKDLTLLPVLNFIQKEEGYISREKIKEISEILEIKEKRIIETISFYHFLNTEKKAPILYLCTNISCFLNGADEILKYLTENKDKLNFDFKECECIGLCDYAPAGLFDFKPLKKLTVKKIEELNEEIRKTFNKE